MAAPDPIIIFNRSGSRADLNPAAQELLAGHTADFQRYLRTLSTGTPCIPESTEKSDYHQLYEIAATTFANPLNPGAVHRELLTLTIGGMQRKYRATAQVVERDNGKQLHVLYLIAVPEEQLAERRLDRDRTGKIEYSPSGIVRYANAAARSMLNLSDDPTGRSFTEVLPHELQNELGSAFAQIQETLANTPFAEIRVPNLHRTIGTYCVPMFNGDHHNGTRTPNGIEQILTDFHGRTLIDLLRRGGQIGKYTLIEPLTSPEEGAYKQAWRAKDDYRNDKDGNPLQVALLVFRPREGIHAATAAATTDATGMEENFRREIAALEKVRIGQARRCRGLGYFPQFLDAHRVKEGGRSLFYIALTYIEGETLERKMQERPIDRSMPLQQIARYGKQLFEALDGAHRLGIVHRDIKPSNIIITPDHNLRVIDLGIAHDDQRPDLLKGSRLYLAPEQLSAVGARAHASSDIWSGCLMLYQLLTGIYPFETPVSNWRDLSDAERVQQEGVLKQNIQTKRLPAPQELDPQNQDPFFHGLSDIVMSGLEREPADRPAASRLATHLRRLHKNFKRPKARRT